MGTLADQFSRPPAAIPVQADPLAAAAAIPVARAARTLADQFGAQRAAVAAPEPVESMTWLDTFEDLTTNVGIGAGSGLEALGALAEVAGLGEDARLAGIGIQDYLKAKLGDEYKAAVDKTWFEIGPDAAWRDRKAWAAMMAQQLPLMLGTGGVGSLAKLGIQGAAKVAGRQIAKETAGKIGYSGAAATAGAGDAASGAIQVAEAAGATPEEKRLAGAAAIPFGVAGGLVLGPQLERIFAGTGGGFFKGAVRGGLSETGEEGLTAVGSAVGGAVGPGELDLSNVPEAMVQGFAGGAGLGGAVARATKTFGGGGGQEEPDPGAVPLEEIARREQAAKDEMAAIRAREPKRLPAPDTPTPDPTAAGRPPPGGAGPAGTDFVAGAAEDARVSPQGMAALDNKIFQIESQLQQIQETRKVDDTDPQVSGLKAELAKWRKIKKTSPAAGGDIAVLDAKIAELQAQLKTWSAKQKEAEATTPSGQFAVLKKHFQGKFQELQALRNERQQVGEMASKLTRAEFEQRGDPDYLAPATYESDPAAVDPEPDEASDPYPDLTAEEREIAHLYDNDLLDPAKASRDFNMPVIQIGEIVGKLNLFREQQAAQAQGEAGAQDPDMPEGSATRPGDGPGTSTLVGSLRWVRSPDPVPPGQPASAPAAAGGAPSPPGVDVTRDQALLDPGYTAAILGQQKTLQKQLDKLIRQRSGLPKDSPQRKQLGDQWQQLKRKQAGLDDTLVSVGKARQRQQAATAPGVVLPDPAFNEEFQAAGEAVRQAKNALNPGQTGATTGTKQPRKRLGSQQPDPKAPLLPDDAGQTPPNAMAPLELEQLEKEIDEATAVAPTPEEIAEEKKAAQSQRNRENVQKRWARTAGDRAPPPTNVGGRAQVGIQTAEAAAVAARQPPRQAAPRPPKVVTGEGVGTTASMEMPAFEREEAPPTPTTAPTDPSDIAPVPGDAAHIDPRTGAYIDPSSPPPARLPHPAAANSTRTASAPRTRLAQAIVAATKEGKPLYARDALKALRQGLQTELKRKRTAKRPQKSLALKVIERLEKAFLPGQVTISNADLGGFAQAQYSTVQDAVYVDVAAAEDVIQATLHELIHAAAASRIRNPDNNSYRKELGDLMGDAGEWWYENDYRPAIGDESNEFFQEEEFLAKILSDHVFADRMAGLRRKAGTPSILERFKVTLRRWLGFHDADLGTAAYFDQLLAFIPDNSLQRDPQERARQNLELDRLGLSETAYLRTTLRTAIRPQPGWQRTLGNKFIRPWLLPVLQIGQIARSYGHLGRDNILGGGHDVIEHVYRLTTQRGGWANQQKALASRIIELFKDAQADKKSVDSLDAFMMNSRMWGLHADRALLDPSNVANARLPGASQAYAELQSRWSRLTDLQKDVFHLVRQFASVNYDEAINQLMLARVRARYDGSSDPVLAQISEKLETMISAPARRPAAPFQVAGITVDGSPVLTLPELQHFASQFVPAAQQAEFVAGLDEVSRELRKEAGPYIPLRRNGDHFTIVKSPKITKQMTGAELDALVHHDRLQQGGEIHITSNTAIPSSNLRQVVYRHEYVATHDTERQSKDDYNAVVAEWAARAGRYGPTPLDTAVSLYTVKREQVHEVLGLTAGTLGAMRAELEKGLGPGAGTQAAELMLKIYLEKIPDTSWRKAQIRAKKITGADQDMLVVLSQWTQGMAYFQAQMKFGHKIAKALGADAQADIKALQSLGPGKGMDQANDLQTLVTYLQRRDAANSEQSSRDLMGERGLAGKLWDEAPALTGLWMLTGFGTTITNAMQPIMFTFPELASRYGAAKAIKAMWQAYRDVIVPTGKETLRQSGRYFKPVNVWEAGARIAGNKYPKSIQDPSKDFLSHATQNIQDANELRMVTVLAADKKLDFGMAADLKAIAKKSGRLWTAIDYAREGAFIFPQAVETTNRLVTALATYRLEKEANPSASQEDLERHASNIVDYSQLNYASENRSAVFNSDYLRAAVVFKTYPQGVIYNILHATMEGFFRSNDRADKMQARKYLGYVAAMTGTFTGLAGILAFEPIYWACVALMLPFADDDDDPEELLRKAMAEVSPELSAYLVKGPLYGAGIADTSRMGLPQLLPVRDIMDGIQDPEAGQEAWWAKIGKAVAGAPGSLVANLLSATYAGVAEGDVMKAVKLATPKAFMINDVARAWEYAQTGIVNGRGEVMLAPEKLNLGQHITRTLGFEPPEVSDYKARNRDYYTQDNRLDNERSEILQEFGRAIRERDVPGRKEALKQVSAWNKEHPDRLIADATLKSSLAGQHKREQNIKRRGVDARTAAQRRLMDSLAEDYRTQQ